MGPAIVSSLFQRHRSSGEAKNSFLSRLLMVTTELVQPDLVKNGYQLNLM